MLSRVLICMQPAEQGKCLYGKFFGQLLLQAGLRNLLWEFTIFIKSALYLTIGMVCTIVFNNICG